MRDRVCDNCGRWIDKDEQLYVMTITIEADPGPVELEAPEEDEDLLAEMQGIVERMEKMSPEEVEEATDQVHESQRFVLCPECREEMHRRFKRRSGILDTD